MPYTNKAIALVWLVIYGLVALAGTGAVTGTWVLLLVVAAFVLPVLILTPWVNLRSAVGALTRTPADRPLDVSDVRGHSRWDLVGDVHRWENEGGAQLQRVRAASPEPVPVAS